MLKDKVTYVEKQMKEKLNEIRKSFNHSGDKGSAVEDTIREFLRRYLPINYKVGHGEIIDSDDRRSRQTDVIVVNSDHPHLFTPDKPGLFFIEGVSAAGSVKTSLTSGDLDVLPEESNQFKQLEPKHGKGSIIHSSESDQGRFYDHRPFFLIAYEAQVSLDTIKKRIESIAEEKRFDQTKIVDGVFILDKGWVINFGDGNGSFKFKRPGGDFASGWVYGESDSVLFDFLRWLSIVMPRIVRFEPVLVNYVFGKNERSV